MPARHRHHPRRARRLALAGVAFSVVSLFIVGPAAAMPEGFCADAYYEEAGATVCTPWD